MNTTTTRKIGQNRGKPRLWIEGQTLVDAGLDHGERWDLHWVVDGDDSWLVIHRNPAGQRKIAGKPGRPIIDIAGSTLRHLGEVSTVALTYRPGFGLIVVAETEEKALALLEKAA